jgi:phosphoribosylaminoimidazole-succinocarboxamide synthase
MRLGTQLAEGKTKVIYSHPDDSDAVILFHKDGITAGDGARRHEIAGKGAIAGRTTANVFALLNAAGIATHFLSAPADNLTIVRRCVMFPLEVVTRRRATGSYLRRNPDVAEGTRFDPPLIEYFLKDDLAHDPQITPSEIAVRNIATPAEVEQMAQTALHVFQTLEQAWQTLDVTLVDLKIEFGRTSDGSIIVADVIDNDSWRIWPHGDKAQMLDKQVYRNAPSVDADLLDAIKARYQHVADLTAQFSR